jgi:uncharacterized protein (TIGR02246 family)
VSESPIEIGNRILGQLEDAWNEADGEAFGGPFADDADFVDIRGVHHSGRTPIAKGHQAILDTIYKGSVNRYQAVTARALGDNVIYVLARSTLNAPSGPLAGENNARFSIVPIRDGEEWKVVAFHNTLVMPQAERPAD